MLRNAVILVISMVVFTPFTRPARAGEAGNRAWESSVVRSITASEYRFAWTSDGELSAPNRAQDLRALIGRDGVQFGPRTGAGTAFRVRLALAGIGRDASPTPVGEGILVAAGDRAELRRPGVTEWFVNDERGIEHGFNVEAPPGGDGPLQLVLAIEGGMLPSPLGADGLGVLFRDAAAKPALRYEKLEVRDATGALLPARMDIDGDSLRIVVDDLGATYPVIVDPLATSAAWSVESNQAGASFGLSVSAAGDVNGDGFGDVIVGALLFDNGEDAEGRAFVYHGSSSGLATTAAWTFESNQIGARAGETVATAGDVNGDGYDDVMLGATRFDNGQADEGRVFVFHGSATGLSTTPNRTLEPNSANASFGAAIAMAGDVNGDGFSDIIVGAPNFDNGLVDLGAVFIYAGSASGIGASPIWSMQGTQAAERLGSAVSGGADVNGDGYDDVMAGAPYFDGGSTDEGVAYLFLGGSGAPSITPNWTREGTQADSQYGAKLAILGDTGGDGYADAVVAAPYRDVLTYTDAGYVEFFRGGPAGLGGFADSLSEPQDNGRFGSSLAAAGDVNGDGMADVIVGAPFWDSTVTDGGAAFVYLGRSSGNFAAYAWSITGTQASQFFGKSVSGAGDVDGTGYGDVIVGSDGWDNTESGEGRAQVFAGSGDGLQSGPQQSLFSGISGISFGRVIASAGDVNGDGFTDMVVGTPGHLGGRVWFYYGSATGFPSTASHIEEETGALMNLGTAVGTAGDVNGDGYDDVVVSNNALIPGDPDCVYVYYGSAAGIDGTRDTVDCSGYFQEFGQSAGTAGDVNGDGYADIIVGSPKWQITGATHGGAFLYLGSADGIQTSPAWSFVPVPLNSGLGSFVATAGDVNRDGFSDVLVSDTPNSTLLAFYGSASGLPAAPSWTETSPDAAVTGFPREIGHAGDVNSDRYSDIFVRGVEANGNSGHVFVYHGGSGGLGVAPAWDIAPADTGGAAIAGVSAAGDLNGDGYSDLVVGTPLYDEGVADIGAVWAFFGSGAGLGTVAGEYRVGAQSAESFGSEVSSVGDVNGDGFGDVAVGGPEYDNSVANQGRIALYLGGGADGADRIPRQQRIHSDALIGLLGLSDEDDGFRIRLRAKTAAGRGDVRIEYQVRSLASAYGTSISRVASFTDSGAPGSWTDLSATLTGLGANNLDKWRARIATKHPLFHYSHWMWPPENGMNEAKLRTNCSTLYYRDQDGDAFGDPTTTQFSCSVLAGYVTVGGDCNDADAAVFPGNPEICDAKDNDCDGSADNIPVGDASIAAAKIAPATGVFSWPAVAGASTYDAVRGRLATLRSSGGDFAAATSDCEANNAAAATFTDPADPGPGNGYWYLVRANNVCGVADSYDEPPGRQIGSRDGEIAASGNACP